MKKILIALDYDPTSLKVAEAGYALAQSTHAQVTLIHAWQNSSIYDSTYTTMGAWQINPIESQETMRSIKSASEFFLENVKKHLTDQAIQIIQKEGDSAQVILEAAIEINADCIVMGTHSQKWLENILLGSVTQEVLRKTTIPLFIIPTKKQE